MWQCEGQLANVAGVSIFSYQQLGAMSIGGIGLSIGESETQ